MFFRPETSLIRFCNGAFVYEQGDGCGYKFGAGEGVPDAGGAEGVGEDPGAGEDYQEISAEGDDEGGGSFAEAF